ncbi:MAG: hypothetical protein KFH87_05870 [Bacteroidetes bacterium]|nr:hypothetical protein [Bacteroidota bacterium]
MHVIKKFLPVFIGVAAGYAYWYFIGCLGGTCPITSNWYTSVLYGGVVGATWLLPTRKNKNVEAGGADTQEDSVSKS